MNDPLKNTGYKGGSPRTRYQYNHKVIKPKIYDNEDAQKIIVILSNQYSKDYIIKEDLTMFLSILKDLKLNNNYDRNYKYNSTVINNIQSTLEQLHSDNRINNNYLQYLINGITYIIDNVIPVKEEIPTPPPPDKVGEGSKLISSYSNNSVNIRNPQEKQKVNKNLKAKDILKISNTVKDHYLGYNISKDELILYSKYLTDLKNGIIIDKTRKELPHLLSKTYEFINGAYNDDLLSISQLTFLIQENGILIKLERPLQPKEEKIIDPTLSTISPGYKK